MTSIGAWFRKLNPITTHKVLPPKPTLRAEFLSWAKWGVTFRKDIFYAEVRPIPVNDKPGHLPLTTDCSGFVTLCAKWAGCSDPNGLSYNGEGYTGTLLDHCEHILLKDVKAGDLFVFGPNPGHHVCIASAKLSDGWAVISHGHPGTPELTTLAIIQARQPTPLTCLRWLP